MGATDAAELARMKVEGSRELDDSGTPISDWARKRPNNQVRPLTAGANGEI
jgi:hypothetical protein